MSKLIMMRGLPASGKSTKAKEMVEGGGNFIRVNRDLIRTMLHFDKWSGRNEGMTVDAEKAVVIRALRDGQNVIVDDCNLNESNKDMWMAIADLCEVKFEVKDFTNVDVHTCIARDSMREKKVGRHVILNMAMQYDLIPELKKIVVCDIDGTVANGDHRVHHLGGDKKDWKAYFAEMGNDTRIWSVYKEAWDLGVAEDAEFVFVSARPEDYREETEKWLKENYMDHFHLIMRPSGNSKPDTVVKQAIYDKFLKHYDIVRVFDDRPAVVRMWRENGLSVTDVGDGVEF